MENIIRTGQIGALIAEYQKATNELINIIKPIKQTDFIKNINPENKDIDCQSIRNIMEHVVYSGYYYSDLIRKQFNDSYNKVEPNYDISTPKNACIEINKMLDYTFENLDEKYHLTDEDIINNIIKTNWKQNYDLEQMLEHAIVHILRHRRQISNIITKLN